MSASERLKALDEQLAPRDAWLVEEDGTLGLAGGNMLAAASLRRVLPQIVAVVEAAEETQRIEQRRSQSNHGLPFAHLHDALAALEEALS